MRKLLLAGILLFEAAVACAQDHVEIITDRIGSLDKRATEFTAAAMSISVVTLFSGRFPHSDSLDDASWEIVLKQLDLISASVRAKAGQLALKSNDELKKIFVLNLRKVDPKYLTEIASFLDSPTGAEWLRANTQYESRLPHAVFTAAAYTIASRQRGKVLEGSGKTPGNLAALSPILMVNAIRQSAANEPSLFTLLYVTQILERADPGLVAPMDEAKQSWSIAAKSGVSNETLGALTASFVATIRAANGGIDIFDVKKNGVESAVRDRMSDLVERALLAVDQTKAGRCNMPLSVDVLRSIDIDVGKVMSGNTPIKPGSVEHSWIAMSFERGCHVKKDFSIALKVWEDMAKAGNVHSYCRIADFYRLGIGTRSNPQLAQEWAEKYRAMAQGRVCEGITINPEHPWVGLSS